MQEEFSLNFLDSVVSIPIYPTNNGQVYCSYWAYLASNRQLVHTVEYTSNEKRYLKISHYHIRLICFSVQFCQVLSSYTLWTCHRYFKVCNFCSTLVIEIFIMMEFSFMSIIMLFALKFIYLILIQLHQFHFSQYEPGVSFNQIFGFNHFETLCFRCNFHSHPLSRLSFLTHCDTFLN